MLPPLTATVTRSIFASPAGETNSIIDAKQRALVHLAAGAYLMSNICSGACVGVCVSVNCGASTPQHNIRLAGSVCPLCRTSTSSDHSAPMIPLRLMWQRNLCADRSIWQTAQPMPAHMCVDIIGRCRQHDQWDGTMHGPQYSDSRDTRIVLQRKLQSPPC